MLSKKHFDKYWNLFQNEFSCYSSFIEYFSQQWVCEESKTNKWMYYHCETNVLLTNNICESLNATIKRDWTNRERQPLNIFLQTLKDVLNDEKLKKNDKN